MVILDSSFLIAYHNKQDVHHSAAAKLMESVVNEEYGKALLLEYVFLEVMTVLLARRGLTAAVSAANALLQAREVEFVPCSDLFFDVLETFRSQKAENLSFTDAAIITAARTQKDTHIATFDQDFRTVDGVSVLP